MLVLAMRNAHCVTNRQLMLVSRYRKLAYEQKASCIRGLVRGKSYYSRP